MATILSDFAAEEQQQIARTATRLKAVLSETEGSYLDKLLAGPKESTDLDKRRIPQHVHRICSGLRKKLDHYYERPEGFADLYRITLPLALKDRIYCLAIRPNILPQSTTAFWEPALNKGQPPVIAITEPPFVRDAKAHTFYIRHFDEKGEDSAAAERVRERLGGLNEAAVEIAFHYVSLAEVRGMLSIFRYFQSWSDRTRRLPPEFRSARQCQQEEAANLVLLGTTRGNPLLAKVESRHHLGLRLDFHTIRIQEPTPREIESLGYFDIENGILTIPDRTESRVLVLVTRASGDDLITLIASNHGLATQATCEYITDDTRVGELIRWAELDVNWKEMPRRFQVLFEVTLDATESRAEKIEPLLFRGDVAQTNSLASPS